jgi:hypothetical protein
LVRRDRGRPGRRAVAAAALVLPVTLTAIAADVADCRSIADERARLACYDALPTTAPPPASAVPRPPVVPPAAPADTAATGAPTATDLFGRDSDTAAAELGAAAGVVPLRELRATLAAVDRAPDGRLLLTLHNGQAWSQVDSRRARVEPGQEVRIRRAAFGSYLLSTIDDRRSALRVRRIR